MDDNSFGVILEDIDSKLQGIVESVSGLQETVNRMDQRLEKVETQTADIPAIKSVVKDQSRQIDDHEVRLDRFKAA